MPAPPTAPLIALFVVALGLLLWRAVTRERREYARFRRLRSSPARQKVYARWLRESVAVIGGLSLAVSFGAGAFVEPVLRDAQGGPAIAAVRDWFGSGIGTVVVWAAVVVFVSGLVVPIVLARRGATLDDVPTLGDIQALLPRTRAELPYGAGLAVSAGVFEELLFRLALPALVFGIVGPDVGGAGLIAFAVCAVVFGMLHVYQGPVGVLTTTVVGLGLSALYVLSGSIVWPILVHVAMDARSLVVIPAALGTAWRSPAATPPPPRPPERPAPE